MRIILTHGYMDHIGALDNLHKSLPEAEIMISERDSRPLSGDTSVDTQEPQTNHIEGLAGLRRELSLLGMNELNRHLQRAALGKSKDEALESMLQAYRVFARERPGVYAATSHAPEIDDLQTQSASEAIIETVLTVLEPYKLSYDEAMHVIRGFRTIGHGFACLEVAGAFGMHLETDESYQRLTHAFLRGLHSR